MDTGIPFGAPECTLAIKVSAAIHTRALIRAYLTIAAIGVADASNTLEVRVAQEAGIAAFLGHKVTLRAPT